MSQDRLREWARRSPESGIRTLLQTLANVADWFRQREVVGRLEGLGEEDRWQ